MNTRTAALIIAGCIIGAIWCLHELRATRRKQAALDNTLQELLTETARAAGIENTQWYFVPRKRASRFRTLRRRPAACPVTPPTSLDGPSG